MALEQFEELIDAAARVSPAARPLPLFYALSQGGRAIAAARLIDNWQLSGHGLKFRLPPKTAPGEATITAAAGNHDSFSRVSQAVGSPQPTTTMTLSEVWSSVVELSEVAIDGDQPEPVAFNGSWHESKPPYILGSVNHIPRDLELRTPQDVELLPGAEEQLRSYLDHFPSLAGWELYDGSYANPWKDGWSVRLRWNVGDLGGLTDEEFSTWRGLSQRLADMADPVSTFAGTCWAYPRVGGVVLKPLMAWWVVLFGLSMLARYHPSEWGDWLNVDNSPEAVMLEAGLDAALEALPGLLMRSLSDYKQWYGEL